MLLNETKSPWQSAGRAMRDYLTEEVTSPIWTPFPGPQTLAYHTSADEMFFGGAAGGGKTDLLLGLALTAHRRSIIYRRETKQFSAIVDRSRELLNGRDWKFNSNEHTWRSADGRVVQFGGAQHEWDWQKHQGHPFDLIGWDELPHFTRLQYRILNGWNRTADPSQRCRIVATGNPPTNPEGRWVVEEFAPWLDSQYPNPAQPGELRWYSVIDEKLTWLESGEEFVHKGERIKPRSRTFIPARVTDNPVYAGTDYVSTLQSLPEPIRSQFLYGDFDAGQEDDPWQVIPTSWVRKAQERWTERPPKGAPQNCLGVDVARGGRDKTVIAARYGSWFAKLRKYEGKQTPDGPSVAALTIKAHEGNSEIHIDVIGVGSSAYDYLKEHNWLKVLPINNAESTKIKDRSGKLGFVNVRAASYWKLREALDPNAPEKIALPPDNELLADLCAPRYKLLTSGIQVESKADIIERIGRSPDCGDAVVLAHWSPYRQLPLLRTYNLGSKRNRSLRIVVCCKEELDKVVIDRPYLLVTISDPGEATKQIDSNAEAPSKQLLGTLNLQFADLDPADFQQTWGDPVPPYNRPVSELAMSKEIGKRFWGFLLRRRDPVPEVFVLADNGDRRAVSLAFAVSDTLNKPRPETIYRAGQEDWKADRKEPPPNRHVYATCKESRGMVIGYVGL
jgi:hypothetical protein